MSLMPRASHIDAGPWTGSLRLSGEIRSSAAILLPIAPATEGGSPEMPEEFQVLSASRRTPGGPEFLHNASRVCPFQLWFPLPGADEYRDRMRRGDGQQ